MVALARHSFEALAKGAMMSECGIAGILAATTRRRRFRARPPRITRCRWRAEHAYHSLSAARTLTPRERPGEQGARGRGGRRGWARFLSGHLPRPTAPR